MIKKTISIFVMMIFLVSIMSVSVFASGGDIAPGSNPRTDAPEPEQPAASPPSDTDGDPEGDASDKEPVAPHQADPSLASNPDESEINRNPGNEKEFRKWDDEKKARRLIELSSAWAAGVDTAAGFSGYTSLFAEEEWLQQWHDASDTIFNNVVFGGIDYWTSEICRVDIRQSGAEGNILYTSSGGQPQVSVFANGERQVLTHPNGTIQYLYKLSYYVDIPQFSAGRTSVSDDSS
ncbi:hypothetical protein ACFLYT_01260, partial [Nanoarchaeota archaeon]